MLVKFEKFNRQLSSLFEWIGLMAMLVMMIITCIDVVGAKVFQWRLFGAIDIVMLCQIVAIAFAASMALILGRHIRVDFFINRLPKRLQSVINSVVFLIGLGLFSLIVWQLCVLGYSFQMHGETSATVRIPYYPFAYGIALASIPVCLIFLLEFLKSLGRIAQK